MGAGRGVQTRVCSVPSMSLPRAHGCEMAPGLKRALRCSTPLPEVRGACSAGHSATQCARPGKALAGVASTPRASFTGPRPNEQGVWMGPVRWAHSQAGAVQVARGEGPHRHDGLQVLLPGQVGVHVCASRQQPRQAQVNAGARCGRWSRAGECMRQLQAQSRRCPLWACRECPVSPWALMDSA